MSERIVTAASPPADPVDALRAGCHAFLDECSSPTTRRLALVDAPAGLGWERWRAIDARHGFGLLRSACRLRQNAGRVRADHIESRAHLLLATLMEGALLIGAAPDPDASTDAEQIGTSAGGCPIQILRRVCRLRRSRRSSWWAVPTDTDSAS